MPHQCVRCGSVIDDGSKQLLTGCESCGSRFFFYLKGGEFKEANLIRESLTNKEINEMESDVRTIMDEKSKDKPIILDIETVKALGPGKFSIDVSALMRGAPVVINISEGKYYIDLASAFKEGSSKELLKQLK